MQKSLTKAQTNFLNFYTYGSWSFDSQTGLVNVTGDFDCSCKRLESFKGIRFGKVTRDFICWGNLLNSLEGAPQVVGGDFCCNSNDLTSLEGAPQRVGGDFDCSYNKLTSLKGAPQKVGGYFNCRHNQLTSLEGAPQKVGRKGFYYLENPILVTPGSSIKDFKRGDILLFSINRD